MIAGGRAIDDTETVEEHHSSPEAYRLSFGITRSTITSSLHHLANFLPLVAVGFVLWQ